MSSTSIQDQGYTPSDFLQKLFKRTSTSTSQNMYSPLSSITNFPTTSYFSSSPLIPLSQPKFSPTKLHRTHSLNEEERLSTKKFKIFYNTLVQGVLTEIQSMEIWQKFQKSLGNPFQYDTFIQELRKIRVCERVGKKQEVQVLEKNVEKKKVRCISQEKERNRDQVTQQSKRRLSARKKISIKNEQKQKMKANIRYIRQITKHGQKYIKTK